MKALGALSVRPTSPVAVWAAGTTVVNVDTGEPLVLYRGHAGGARHRALSSYTSSPEVASVYALARSDEAYGEGAQVLPVIMRMVKPFEVPGAQVRVSWLLRHLPGLDAGKLALDLWRRSAGKTKLADAFAYRVVAVTGDFPPGDADPSDEELPLAEAEFSAMLRGISALGSYARWMRDDGPDDAGLASYLDVDVRWPDGYYDVEDDDRDDDIQGYDLVVDTYAVVDSDVFVAAVRAAGYDGIVHTDLFGAVSKFRELLGKEPDDVEGLDEIDVADENGEIIQTWAHTTWRPLDEAAQVRPVFGGG